MRDNVNICHISFIRYCVRFVHDAQGIFRVRNLVYDIIPLTTD